MEETGVVSSQPANQPPTNPLLSRIQLPGETFTLPSGGLFYTHGELDPTIKDAEIHVHPMTAIDEITIKTPDLLFSGEAVKQVFARCIPQVLKIDTMLAKDIDFLLVCLRKVSYGNELRLDYTHDCDNANEHTYTVDIGEFIQKSKRIDPTTISTKFSVTMPNDQVVHLQPVMFKEFVHLMQISNPEDITDPIVVRDMMIESVSNIITSVDEVTDKNLIKEWLAQVPPQYLRLINDHVDQTLEWGPEFKSTIKCKDCGGSAELIAPMNPLYFFT